MGLVDIQVLAHLASLVTQVSEHQGLVDILVSEHQDSQVIQELMEQEHQDSADIQA